MSKTYLLWHVLYLILIIKSGALPNESYLLLRYLFKENYISMTNLIVQKNKVFTVKLNLCGNKNFIKRLHQLFI